MPNITLQEWRAFCTEYCISWSVSRARRMFLYSPTLTTLPALLHSWWLLEGEQCFQHTLNIHNQQPQTYIGKKNNKVAYEKMKSNLSVFFFFKAVVTKRNFSFPRLVIWLSRNCMPDTASDEGRQDTRWYFCNHQSKPSQIFLFSITGNTKAVTFFTE